MVLAFSKNKRAQVVFRRPPFDPASPIIVLNEEIELMDLPLEVGLPEDLELVMDSEVVLEDTSVEVEIVEDTDIEIECSGD